jgi:hypothetical protein
VGVETLAQTGAVLGVILGAAIGAAWVRHDARERRRAREVRQGLRPPDPVNGPAWDPEGPAAELYRPRVSMATRAGRLWGRIRT